METKVNISKVEHRGEQRLRIIFPYNEEIGGLIKKIDIARWSNTFRSWLLPFTRESIEILRPLFKEIVFEDEESRILGTLEIANDIDEGKYEILIWKEDEYIYLKMDSTDLLEKSFLSGIELSRNYYGSGYWKIKYAEETAEILRKRYPGRLRQWPSVVGEILEYEDKQRNKNKITAIIAGKQMRVVFDWNREVINFIKTMPFSHWDPTNKWWTYAHNEKTLKALKDFCTERKYNLLVDDIPVLRKASKRVVNYNDPTYRRCPEEMIEKLKNRRYSENTIKQYVSIFEEFINYHRKVAIEDIGQSEIKEYISYLVQERRVSGSYQNLAVNAIKYYFEQVVGGPRRFIEIDRPRRDKQLPEVLGREEVFAMISTVNNLKHKFIIALLYSTGLRRGELLKLKLTDVDKEHMKIWVRDGKGSKDRYVQLGRNTLKLFEEYVNLYNPKEYVIEGRGEQYSTSSIVEIVKMAAQKAGIHKRVTPHMLRHSYATHMLEDGIDTRFIQELLGHSSIKTTQIYSHVTNRNISNIENPFDKMDI